VAFNKGETGSNGHSHDGGMVSAQPFGQSGDPLMNRPFEPDCFGDLFVHLLTPSSFLKDFQIISCHPRENTPNHYQTRQMTAEAKTYSIKLPNALAARSEALKEKTGISEAAILRQAITAGLPSVEQAMDSIHSPSVDLDPADQAVS
jgi:hypothetical protein